MSTEPSATVFQPASGHAPGHRPWIVLWNVKDSVKVTAVANTCAADKICSGGKGIAVYRAGNYLRPKTDLAASTRVQITSGKKLLADVTINADPAGELPAWDGVELVSAKDEPERLCSPAGPAVHLKVKPSSAKLDGAVLLVYLSRPDVKSPQSKLAYVTSLGGGGAEVTLTNSLGAPAWLKKLPTELWVLLADGDGHVGEPIKLI